MDVLKRNNVTVLGEGQPIIFAHGYALDQTMWRHISPAFEKTHKVVLFDHVGAGLSDTKSYNKVKYNSLGGYADDLLEICQELKLEKPILIGHSVSAMIGVLAAIQRPSYFEKLVLIGPSACYINHDDYYGGFTQEDVEGLLSSIETNFEKWSTTMAPALMRNPERPELSMELAKNFQKIHPEIAGHFARTTFLSDNRSALAQLQVPTLILQASDDLVVPLSAGEFIDHTIPKAQLVQLKATGHFPPLSAPAETILAIKTFI
jgi:sigma-B regulation protein RsbQ